MSLYTRRLEFVGAVKGLCEMAVNHLSPTTVPYPVCKDCRRIFLAS